VSYDLVIEGGTVVRPDGRAKVHLYVRDGCIAAVSGQRHAADRRIDADGLLVLPGMVDTHVHLMDPGPTEREDFPTGTAAAAARGVTTIVEHTHAEPIREVSDLEDKRGYLDGRSNVDFGLAAHVWPDRIDGLSDLWSAGITFFKIFTCTTHGVPGLDAAQLLRSFRAMASFGGSALVHCEDESITEHAEQVLRKAGREDGAVISEWRNREAELVAVQVTALLAELTGARASIAHVSNPAVAELIARARARGAALGAEACPQYLLLREDELVDHGSFRKFTPPARARSSADEDAMWDLLRRGVLTHIATDHAPATVEQKTDGSIWDVHFGLPGLDTTLPLMIDSALRGRISVEEVVQRYSWEPARWYGLAPRKGHLGVGADADLVLVDPASTGTIRNEDVISKAGWTPYAGRDVRGSVLRTFLRGDEIGAGGRAADERTGRFLPGPGAR